MATAPKKFGGPARASTRNANNGLEGAIRTGIGVATGRRIAAGKRGKSAIPPAGSVPLPRGARGPGRRKK